MTEETIKEENIEALKDELEEMKAFLHRNDKYYSSLQKTTSMSVTSDLKRLVKLEQMGDETYEKIIRRVFNEAKENRIKMRKISSLVAQEGDFENTVKAIRRVIASEIEMPSEIEIPHEEENPEYAESYYIDYSKVAEQYDSDLSDRKNAANMGISYSAFNTWRRANGYPAKGQTGTKGTRELNTNQSDE